MCSFLRSYKDFPFSVDKKWLNLNGFINYRFYIYFFKDIFIIYVETIYFDRKHDKKHFLCLRYERDAR